MGNTVYLYVPAKLIIGLDEFLADHPELEISRSALLKFLATFDGDLIDDRDKVIVRAQGIQLYMRLIHSGPSRHVGLRTRHDGITQSSKTIQRICCNIVRLGLQDAFKDLLPEASAG